MNLKTLLHISRPKFWLYAGGTFLVGIAAGAQQVSELMQPLLLVYFIYFMLPANIFIYGINDLYDDDTDALNPKKGDKEHLLKQNERYWLSWWVYGSLAVGLLLAILAPNLVAALLLVLFLFLAWAYSALPLRLKARPIIDAVSNVHYALIGFLGYAFFTGTLPPWWVIIAAWCWTAAMHIFSAIPDIVADSMARLRTTAVVLGYKKALVVCTGLWLCVLGALWWGGFFLPWSIVLTLLYVLVPLCLVKSKQTTIVAVYWYFPVVNAVVGCLLFWAAIAHAL